MADRRLSTGEAARFFAERDARDAARVKSEAQPAPPQCPSCSSFLSPEAQYAPATCPQCGVTLPEPPATKPPPKASGRGRGRGGAASSPDGKPKASPHPWRRDKVFLETLAESFAKHTKAAIDAAIGGNGGGTTKLSLAHYGADGNCAAELREEGGKIYLRIGDASVSARAGTQRAAELQARFDAIGAAILP